MNVKLKAIALFCISLMIFSIFPISSLAATTTSTVPGCCEIGDDSSTYKNQVCKETIPEVQCEDGRFNSYKTCALVQSCKTGVCVPQDGKCKTGSTKVECDQEGGTWYDASSIDQVPDCQIGCCNIEDVSCTLQQKNYCVNSLAGGDSSAFDTSATDVRSCDLKCATSKVGCCVSGNSCKTSKGSTCSGDFYPDTFCSQKPECKVKIPHKFLSTGKGLNLEDNEQFIIYWFNDKGQREEVAHLGDVSYTNADGISNYDSKTDAQAKKMGDGRCKYPQFVAYDPDGIGGTFEAVCKSTECVATNDAFYPNSFKNGDSICVNLPQGFYNNVERSKALREYALTCQLGEVIPDTLDNKALNTNRESRCEMYQESISSNGEPTTRWATKIVDNNWEGCLKCGETNWLGQAWQTTAFIPIIGTPLSSFAQPCHGSGFTGIIDPDNSEWCKTQGDCGGPSSDDFDNDFWSPIGSCNPTYTPGINTAEQCNKCGQGGNGVLNMCTEEECNRMGDCMFEEDSWYDNSGLIAAGGLALGTCTAVTIAAGIIVGPDKMGLAFSGCILPTGTNTIYAGLVATTYTLIGESYAGTPQYTTKFSSDNNKAKIIDILKVAKTIQNEEPTLSGFQSITLSKNAWLYAFSLTAGYAPDITINAYLDGISWVAKTLLSKELYNKLSSFLGKKIQNILSGLGLAANIITVGNSFHTGKCSPETNYDNPDKCSLCGAGEGQWWCTKERCEVLGGQNCLYEPYTDGSGISNGKCISKPSSDKSRPNINKMGLEFYEKLADGTYVRQDITQFKTYNSASLAAKGYTLEESNKRIVKSTTGFDMNNIQLEIPRIKTSAIKLYLQTSEEAYCSYSTVPGKDITQTGTMVTLNSEKERFYPKEHISDNINIIQNLPETEYKLYIKCKDAAGNAPNPTDDEILTFKLEELPDYEGPVIEKIDPESTAFPVSTQKVKLALRVYDPATKPGTSSTVKECRYSKDKDNFEEMTGIIKCTKDVPCLTYKNKMCKYCETEEAQQIDLSNLNAVEQPRLTSADLNTLDLSSYLSGSYTFKISCIDTQGNTMKESKQWTIAKKALFDFEITSPENYTYQNPPNITITSKENIICKYKLDDMASLEDVNSKNLISTLHERAITEKLTASPTNQLINPHNLEVTCTDMASNVVTKTHKFYVMEDKQEPYLIQFYESRGDLIVLMNEKTQCKYSTKSFNYDDEEAILMEPAEYNSTSHNTAVGQSKTFYVRCMDEGSNPSNQLTLNIP